MANNDFRKRLRAAETEYNPAAWEQMNELLNHMSKKDKKRPFWIWLSGFLMIAIIILGTYFFIGKTNKELEYKDLQKDLSTIETNRKENSMENAPLQSLENPKSTLENFVTPTENKNNTTSLEQNSQAQKQYEADSPLNSSENLVSKQYRISNSNIESPLDKKESETDQDKQIQSKLTNQSLGSIAKKENIIPTNSIETTDTNLSTRNSTEGNQEKSTNRNNDLEIQVEKLEQAKLLDIATTIARLDVLNNRLQQTETTRLPFKPTFSPLIKPLDRSYRFLMAKSGYAVFNDNAGYHFGLGYLHEIDQIIAFQTEVAYSAGRDKNQFINDVFEQEQQLDINLIALLSLFQTEMYKLRLEVGLGYTLYSGNRIIEGPINQIDERSSTGINYNVGLSFTKKLNSGDGIGIKLGAISYDDAIMHLSLNYLKRF